jgi:hypothetical protein
VIFDAQQDAAVAIVRRAPDIQRIDDVPEVQMSGRRGREACQHVQIRIAPERRCAKSRDHSTMVFGRST